MSDVAPDPDDRIVETGGSEPPLLPEEDRPADPTEPDAGAVPEDERLVPDPGADDPGGGGAA